MRTPLRCRAWICAVVCMLWGCNAHIDFSADPRHVCPGQAVRLTWNVVGSATMAVDPPLPEAPSGHVPSTGEAVIRPQTRTRVELHATRALGHPTSSVKEI